MFSCFYCKRCEAACSSGVPLTEVFTDAKKDLQEMGFDGPGTTSITKLNCARCLICVSGCPHEARSHNGKKIVVDHAKCQSCGICLEHCPAGAAQIENSFGTSKDELVEVKKGSQDPEVFGGAAHSSPPLLTGWGMDSLTSAMEMEGSTLIKER